MVEKAASEHRHIDVGGLSSGLVVWHCARLDSLKPESAVLSRTAATKPSEFRIKGQVTIVGRVIVAPVAVGLPDLDHGIGHWIAITVKDAPLDADAFADAVWRNQRVADRIGA
jgi:hypothetical protein